jgi:hypothetical protein
MKKVIKLKESDLINIIKRVIKEQSSTLESKLRDNGYVDAKNTGGKKVLVKKTTDSGNFFFEFKENGCDLNVLNPSNKTITKLNLKKIGKNKIGEWYTKGFFPEVECERLMNLINNLIDSKPTYDPTKNPVVSIPTPMDEERFDFEKMSDDELHDLHPHVKKNLKHFKNFEPTSEYLGWKGEVSKRNIYKRYGKFHNAFDKEK